MNPNLFAVQNPSVAVAGRDRADTRHVRAGLRFRDAISHELFSAHRRAKPSVSLQIRAVPNQQRRNQLHQPALIRYRGVTARELFHDKSVGKGIETRTAQLFRNADSEQAQPAHLRINFLRESLVAVQFFGRRADDLVGELPRHHPHLTLLFIHIHGTCLVTMQLLII